MTGIYRKIDTKELLMQITTLFILLPILIYPLLRQSNFIKIAVGLVLGCLFLVFVVSRGVFSFTKISIAWLFTLFPILFNSYVIQVGLYGFTLWWVALLLFLIIGATKNHKWLKTAIWTMAILTCIYAFSTILLGLGIDFGLSQLGNLFRNGSPISQGDMVSAGLTAHYSHNGMYISLGIIVWFAISCYTKKKLHYVITVAFVVALILTQKRGPLIAIVLAVVLTYFIINLGQMQKKIAGLIIGVIGLASVVYIMYLVNPSLFSVFDRFFGDDGLSNREYLWEYAIQLFKANILLGAGWGYFPVNVKVDIDNLSVSSVHAHNIYLELLADTGIIGFLCIIIPMVFTLVSTIKLIKYINKNKLKDSVFFAPLVFSLGFQIFFMVYGLSGNPIYDYQMFIPYMLSVAFVAYFTTQIKKQSINAINKEVL
ncbi:MAG: O-antigen ligase family protein [Ruminococcus sp.]